MSFFCIMNFRSLVYSLWKCPFYFMKVEQLLDYQVSIMDDDALVLHHWVSITLIARFMGPTWGPSGADRTQVGPMLAPWSLLSGAWMLMPWYSTSSARLSSSHDDVIKWKHFPRYWPFVRGCHRWIPLTKTSDVELWCFFLSAPEKMIE